MIRELIKQGNEFLNAFGNDDNIAPGLSSKERKRTNRILENQ
jgi:hypothetical protein